jgi:hypothetical protein
MTKTVLTGILLLFLSGIIQSQEWYLKSHIDYHIPITTQLSPEYFSASIYSSGESNHIPLHHDISKFSLARGFSYGLALVYKFNDVLGAEIGLDYFGLNKTFRPDDNTWDYRTGWKFKTIDALPTIVLYKTLNQLTFSSKFGVIVGFSSLEKSINCRKMQRTYKMKSRMSLGYSLGMEVDYPIDKKLALSVEASIDNLFYTPRKAILVHDDFGYMYYDGSGQIPACYKEIDYLKKISDPGSNKYYIDNENDDLYYSDLNKPSKRFAETLKLNSFHYGIGLIYKIERNEKN